MWWGLIGALSTRALAGDDWWRELPTTGAGLDVWDTLVPSGPGLDSSPLSKSVMTILFSNQPYFNRKPRFEARSMTNPLLCDLIILTTHNLTQQDYDCRPSIPLPAINAQDPDFRNITEPTSLYDAFRQAYANWQPGLCHVNIQTPTWLNEGDKGFNVTLGREYRFLERYRAALVMSELGLENKLRHSSGGKPPVIYLDRATIPTNKYISARDFVHTLDDGFEACSNDCDIHPANLTHRDVAFAVGLNAVCNEDKQWLSEGSFYFRPSRTSTALFATILHLSSLSMLKSANDDLAFTVNSTIPHHVRLMTRALDLLFNLRSPGDLEAALQLTCEQKEKWQRSTEDSESSVIRPVHLIDRKIQPEQLLEKPEGVGIRAMFKPEESIDKTGQNGHEPLYMSVMPPRWLAGPACPWHLLTSDTSHVWHPTDFGAHFKGCERVGHFTDLWRAAVSEESLPWLDDDEEWEVWRGQSVAYWEPELERQSRDYLLSPECPK